MNRRLNLAIVVALQVVLLGVISAWTAEKFTPSHVADWTIYQRYAELALAGELPYVSFKMEYPPGAIVPLALPRLVLPADASPFAYRASLVVFNVFWSALLTLVVARTARVLATIDAGRSEEEKSGASQVDRIELRAAATCGGLCVACALILPYRFDIFPALLSAIALLCALTRRPVACGLWLGMGIACKLYPVVFLPVILIYFLRSGRAGAWVDALKIAAMSVVPTAGFLLPYVLLGSTAYMSFLRYHTQRGLQVETLWAGVVMTAHRWGLTDASVIHNFGAGHVRSPLADVLQGVQPIVAIGALLAVLGVAWVQLNGGQSEAPRARSFVRLSLLIVLTFILFNKVFSTQFILWPIALIALMPMLGRRRLVPAMLVVILLTMYGFPIWYQGLREMAAVSVYVLDERNLLMLGMMIPLLFAGKDSPQGR